MTEAIEPAGLCLVNARVGAAAASSLRIVGSRIGPFTSIGEGAVIERSGIDHSVILEGSRITDIARLEDSLIGRRVVVHPGSARDGALGLLVGDDCKIELGASRRGDER